MRYTVLLCWTCFLVIACGGDDSLVLRDYYFPLADQVYVYSAQDSSGVEYWVSEKVGEEGIRTRVYNGKKEIQQESQEKFYSNGVNLESMSLDGKPVEIESGFIFPFQELDSSEVVFYRIKWESVVDSIVVGYELIRNRRWVGFTSCEVFGESQSCAKFTLTERIISKGDGNIEVSTTGEELYAKGIGLIYRKRQISDAFTIEQYLLEIREVSEEFHIQ